MSFLFVQWKDKLEVQFLKGWWDKEREARLRGRTTFKDWAAWRQRVGNNRRWQLILCHFTTLRNCFTELSNYSLLNREVASWWIRSGCKLDGCSSSRAADGRSFCHLPECQEESRRKGDEDRFSKKRYTITIKKIQIKYTNRNRKMITFRY